MQYLGTKIRQLRTDKSLFQDKLVESAGVSRQE